MERHKYAACNSAYILESSDCNLSN